MGNEENIVLGKQGNIAGEIYNESAELAEILSNSDNQQNTTSSEVLIITSYPPRECGIATYSQNLINAINNRFSNFFKLRVCALQQGDGKYYYPEEVTSVLNTSNISDFSRVAGIINSNDNLQAVIIQHEFDLFKPNEESFLNLIKKISKPVVVVFHTIKSQPSQNLKLYIQNIASSSALIVVMAKVSQATLISDYQIPKNKIEVITYGTHFIVPSGTSALKEKYKLTGKKVLTTVGLLSPGKGIETALEALPAVIKMHPEIIFLIIGKTHPEELKYNGEKYRIMLEARVKSLKLQNYVHFLNGFFTSEILKEYLLITDVCLFNCSDLNRAMSGTFSFAASCGCPIISTPTAHASEFLGDDGGYTYENGNANDLSNKINQMLDDPALRKSFSENITKKSLNSIWENSALLHSLMLNRLAEKKLLLKFRYPPIKLDFIELLTDKVGILKSAYKGEPDLRSGYTLDDNALALFIYCMHYKISGDENDLAHIRKYLKFVYHCHQPSGIFLKYMDYERRFTPQNYKENLEDTQAKAIWALGYLVSLKGLVPAEMIDIAALIFQNSLLRVNTFISARAIAFALKGLYYYYSVYESDEDLTIIKTLADKLVEKYKEQDRSDWHWFEDSFIVSGSIIPVALLNTWLLTGNQTYKDIAGESFKFLSSHMFNESKIKNGSKKKWIPYNYESGKSEEQPIDIAFNVLTSSKFYLTCKDKSYFRIMDLAYNWFLGNNRLKQMMYNPVTGSCFGGFDGNNIDLHQTAESTLSYTLARMVVEKYKFEGENHIIA